MPSSRIFSYQYLKKFGYFKVSSDLSALPSVFPLSSKIKSLGTVSMRHKMKNGLVLIFVERSGLTKKNLPSNILHRKQGTKKKAYFSAYYPGSEY